MVVPSERVVTLARELCAGEGWDPDELIDLAPSHCGLARQDVDHEGRIFRWRLYAEAARKVAAQQDAWEVF